MGRKRKNKNKFSNDFKGISLIVSAIVLFTFLVVKSSGIISGIVNSIAFGIFGISSYIIPILLLLIGIYVIMSSNKVDISSQIVKAVTLVTFISTIICLFSFKENSLILFDSPIKFLTSTMVDAIDGNILYGLFGAIFANICVKLVGVVASKIILIFSTFMLTLFIFNISLRQFFYFIYNIFAFIVNTVYSIFQTLFRRDDNIDMENIDNLKSIKKENEDRRNNKRERRRSKQSEIDDILKVNSLEQVEIDFDKIENNNDKKDESDIKASEKRDDFFKKQIEKKEDNNVKEVLTLDHGKLAVDEEYNFPPIDILAENKKSGRNIDKRTIHATAVKLQKTLASFGVDAKVSDFTKGPTVTRYELTPSIGVKVSKIVNLADDIALNLAAKSIRIEAPIPGKAAVGIEVPNAEPEPVFLREVIDSREFKEHKSNVAYALGRDAAGDIIVGDIAKMPHMLIAGSTGSGKSVCINSIIVSLLYKSKPSDVKLILVDPKMVELSCYNGIPHLLIPVVTDPKKAAGALNWAVSEMVNRYNLFASKGTKDIKGYNAIIEKDLNGVKLPQIVIIIDELADLMMVAPNDVEDAICRLAQMARAAGMHLIIATQRPSVDVITGIIKANIPSRIAFTVSSNVDSRTILDSAGAEKLLGKGDMLYFPVGANKPQRIQGTWVSEQEIDTVVASIKRDDVVVYDDEIIEKIEKTELKGKGNSSSKDPDDIENVPDEDPLLNDAIDLVIDMGQASASMLQRRFKIGYSRAGRIVDQMEERGLISGYEGSKPRKVLIKKEEWQEIKFQMQQAERKENKEE